MGNIEHTLQIYDIGGQDEFKQVIDSFGDQRYSILKESNLIIGVVDPIRYLNSVKYISSIFSSIENYNKFYVATKKDLMNEERGQEVGKLENMIQDDFVWVSSKTGENIESLTKKIISIISLPKNYLKRDINKRYSKAAFIGLGGSGKTSLLLRLKKGKFIKESKQTMWFNVDTLCLKYQE